MVEDRRIALAAVLITGVVGIVGAVATWRAAVSSQQASSRDERARADLVEFRAVLDQAFQRLDTLEVKVQLEMVAWETRSHATYLSRHLGSDEAYADAVAAADRLGVRLGFKARGYILYRSAISGIFGASSWMYNHTFDGDTVKGLGAYNKGRDAVTRFDDEAHRLAGSRLPTI
jgi:hypothetical protein